MNQKTYEFGGFSLDSLRRTFSTAEGEPIRLKPKVMDTLLCLLEHAGNTVDKAALMDRVWPNAIVEEHNLSKNISVLRQILGEAPEDHRFIVTEPGRGYRFVASVRVIDPENDNCVAGSTSERPTSRGTERIRIAAGLIAASAVVVFFSLRFYADGTSQSPSAGRPYSELGSIAVLAFEGSNSNSNQDWFSEGIAAAVRNNIEAFGTLRVTAESSSFLISSADMSTRTIAETLNVSNVLRGEVDMNENSVTIRVTLHAATGNESWRESYEIAELSELFEIEKRISRDVIAHLVDSATLSQSADDHTPSWEVLALQRKAEHIWRHLDSGRMLAAREFLEAAVELDEDYLPTLIGLANIFIMAPGSRGELSPTEAFRRSDELFNLAASKWPDHPLVLHSGGWRAYSAGDLEGASRNFTKMLTANPANPPTAIVPFLTALNRPEEATRIGEQIIARDPICALCFANLAHAYLLSGDYEKVKTTFDRAAVARLVTTQSNINLRSAYIASLVLSQNHEEALALLADLREATLNLRPFVLAWSAMALKGQGRDREFNATIGELETAIGSQKSAYFSLYRAAVFAYSQNYDLAFDVLEQAQDEIALARAPAPIQFSNAAWYDLPPLSRLRTHPRWEEFSHRAGIDEYRQRRDSIELMLPLN